ncbi:MAG: hypothetical protein AAGF11_48415 [Myxococcota bacterium]
MTFRYALLHEIDGQARARLRLFGPDARRFLQGTLTADVEGLASGRAVAAALCTVKGKLVSELVLMPGAEEDELCALVPAEEAESLAAHFDKHIIMDEVEVESQGPVGVALVWPEAADPAAPTVGLAPGLVMPPGVEVWPTRHPAPGQLCVAQPEVLGAALAEHVAVDAAGWDAYRIATASPAWGREIEAGFFPPEIGFVYAVSYDKGCFLGQEPLARIHARGQVNRVMVRIHADRAPAAITALASEDRANAGRWTSWAPSPGSDEGGGVDGLAVVRRALASPGQRLRTTDDPPIEVEIRSKPLGDDPGVGGRSRAATVKLGGPR